MRLTSMLGLVGSCEGGVRPGAAASEERTASLTWDPVRAADFSATIGAVDVADPRWPPRLSDSGKLAVVEGPPSYVALIRQTLDALKRRVQAGPATVVVFRGNAG